MDDAVIRDRSGCVEGLGVGGATNEKQTAVERLGTTCRLDAVRKCIGPCPGNAVANAKSRAQNDWLRPVQSVVFCARRSRPGSLETANDEKGSNRQRWCGNPLD